MVMTRFLSKISTFYSQYINLTCILGSHSTQLRLCCEQIKWRHSVGRFAGIILGQLHLKNFHSYVSLYLD